jgi:hypothetical protein
MANLLDDYDQSVVTRSDWMKLFGIYTRTQRKNGRPYIAEGANPDNGSWAGFDSYYHSEHYFHSGYVDLVITGVVGLRPRADDTVEVQPMAPESWDYFALDGVRYHGHKLSIVWDRKGNRYRHGRGLTVIADGRAIARSPRLTRLTAFLPPAKGRPLKPRLSNFAVHNDSTAFPKITASYSAPKNPPSFMIDGNYWYHQSPANRWTTIGSRNVSDTVTVDFGVAHAIEQVKLYVLDDGIDSPVQAPASYSVQTWDGAAWRDAKVRRRSPLKPTGHLANVVEITPASISRLRVVLTPRRGTAVGMTELETWGR